MIKTFNIFVNEELKISKMDDRTLKIIKENFLIRLDEYREYILSNIQYDENDNKIKYKEFEKIDINVIIRELTNEFSKDFIKEMSVEMFLKKINELLELKNRNVKKRIRESFREYFNSIDKRIDNIKNTNNIKFENPESEKSILTKNIYNSEKYEIQIELLKLQEWVIKNNKRIAIVFEGRDAAGKGSTIKRFTEYLNPKGFKTVTLGIPSEYEKKHWFERYEKHLPNPGEIVFFDRSWYNRAVIEPAMGYCTEDEYNDFMNKVTDWEENLIKNGLILIKIWFSITKEKQIERFERRRKNPLIYWKFSKNDANSSDKWDIISKFKNQMFEKTSTNISPWVIINSNDKKIGRLNAMRYVLSVVDYDNKIPKICEYYPEIVTVIN